MSEDTRALALAEELGAQLRRLKGAGPKIVQLLSMVQFDGPPTASAPPVGFGRVKKVIEQDLDARMRELFADFDEEPVAIDPAAVLVPSGMPASGEPCRRCSSLRLPGARRTLRTRFRV